MEVDAILFGYAGKLLFVDLTSGAINAEPLDKNIAEQFIGGYGIGAKILFERMPAGVDPLGPDNILGFTTGPVTGTAAISSGRYTVVAKSPLTGTWGDANSGGAVGAKLKAAGFDAVFFSGKSDRPVSLVIDNGDARLVDAFHLWGKDTVETEDTLRQELGSDFEVACIGPAGEKLSLISCVINDKGRAAGRSGLGAVMGSKNLKALAVRGKQEVPVGDPEGLKKLASKIRTEMREGPNRHYFETRAVGTCLGTAANAVSGDSPVKNWGGVGLVDFPEAPNLDGSNMVAKYQRRRWGCHRCALACGGIMEVPDGPYALKEAHKPEYETMASFGSMCLNGNVESIIKCNDICNRAGLDTISAGAAIAFAIECYENGLITREDTGGIELTWGNHAAIVAMTEKLAAREGFGDILAEGVRKAAERIGKGAERFAVTAGGQELPMHDSKNAPSWGLTYVADATPGRHMQGGYGLVEFRMLPGSSVSSEGAPGKWELTGKAELHASRVQWTHLINCLGFCIMPYMTIAQEVYFKEVSLVLGREFGQAEVVAAGNRIAAIRQAFNVREGFKPADITIHPRALGQPPQEAGPLKGFSFTTDSLMAEYFAVMDWDVASGKPSKAKLEALGGLEEVAAALYG